MEEVRKAKRPPRIPSCHPERKHHSKGLCESCYKTRWQLENPHANSGKGWVRLNPEKAYEYKRRAGLKLLGVTLEEYEQMWTAQNGKCANPGCDVHAPLRMPDHRKGGLCVDHDHTTGAIRGLLCSGCNCALGQAKEDAGRLQGLISYLSSRIDCN